MPRTSLEPDNDKQALYDLLDRAAQDTNDRIEKAVRDVGQAVAQSIDRDQRRASATCGGGSCSSGNRGGGGGDSVDIERLLLKGGRLAINYEGNQLVQRGGQLIGGALGQLAGGGLGGGLIGLGAEYLINRAFGKKELPKGNRIEPSEISWEDGHSLLLNISKGIVAAAQGRGVDRGAALTASGLRSNIRI